jgi:hypothetical protein
LPRVFSVSFLDSFDVLDFQVDQISSHMQQLFSILPFPIKLTIHDQVWMFLAEETTVPYKYIFL